MGAVSRAAEGFDRRAFTVSEVLRMQGARILSDQERHELIEGEIVLRQANGSLDETLKCALTIDIARALPDPLWMGVESTIYLDDDTFVEPDIVVYGREFASEGPKGADILLASEVSASSLAYDRGFESELCARDRFQQYWAVDAFNRTTYQFFEPHSRNWRRRVERGPDEFLSHPLLPGFSLRLSDY